MTIAESYDPLLTLCSPLFEVLELLVTSDGVPNLVEDAGELSSSLDSWF